MSGLAALPALYLVAGCTAYVFAWAGVPLAWLLGPLTSTAVLTMTGVNRTVVPVMTRPFGQIVVATFVGAHFTPAALHALLASAPLLLTATCGVLAAAALVARLQMRLGGSDRVTALLACVPTSPVEAGVLAERFGVDPAPVILAQTMRIIMVVSLVPVLLLLGAAQGNLPPAAPHQGGVAGIALTLAAALAGPALLRWGRISNPFFLGPLFTAALLSALDLPSYDLPAPLLSAAQILLGTWLGACLRPDLLLRQRRLIAAMLLSSFLLIASCALAAWGLSALFAAPFATVMLGMAPGGVTEMALTAGLLGLDVAFVTAMQITRIFLIMPNLARLVRLTARRLHY